VSHNLGSVADGVHAAEHTVRGFAEVVLASAATDFKIPERGKREPVQPSSRFSAPFPTDAASMPSMREFSRQFVIL
jgi:hypothetical protein